MKQLERDLDLVSVILDDARMVKRKALLGMTLSSGLIAYWLLLE